VSAVGMADYPPGHVGYLVHVEFNRVKKDTVKSNFALAVSFYWRDGLIDWVMVCVK
jgi:hypothetical protein